VPYRGGNPYNNFKGFERGVPGTNSAPSAFDKAVLSIAIIAIFLVAFLLVRVYIRRKRKRNNAITSSLNWQPAYKDRPATEEVNIAPKRSSIHTDVYEDAMRSSTRDTMAAHLAAAAAARSAEAENDDTLEEDDGISDHEPQVDMGPPLDDDGHELHNVSIV